MKELSLRPHVWRILKTEHTLAHMSDQDYRKRKHQGLLKGEEVHQLGRNISFANRGKITNRDVTGLCWMNKEDLGEK